jgi:phosphoribosyl 1,2-cyclic phosphodiesterase
VKVTVLASGSKGNSMLIEGEGHSFLIDAGLSYRELNTRLKSVGSGMEKISFVLFSHSHCDHTRAAMQLVRNKIPFCACDETMDEIRLKLEEEQKGYVDLENAHIFPLCGSFPLGEFKIYPIQLSHDVHNVGFRIESPKDTIVAGTDTGYLPDEFIAATYGASKVIIESNYDPEMLRKNPNYPNDLKARIRSKHGHLENIDCAKGIEAILKDGKKTFVLAHLSEQNNTPELAFNTNEMYLREQGIRTGFDYKMFVSAQHIVTRIE